MTRIDEAKRIFQHLNVKNRAVLLGYFKTALKAENSVKKSLGLVPKPGYGLEDAEKGTDWQEPSGRTQSTGRSQRSHVDVIRAVAAKGDSDIK
jgi:hypothetical protein